MAWMIPPQIDPRSNPPPGEEKLFRELQDDPDTKDWIVLHSLDVAAHHRRVAGEVDFVVIIPGMGVLCLEVKSHDLIECRNGEWLFGKHHKKGHSPFRQAFGRRLRASCRNWATLSSGRLSFSRSLFSRHLLPSGIPGRSSTGTRCTGTASRIW